MNRIDFKEGGFPLNTDTLEFMQAAYSKSIKALAAIGGDNYILTGCTGDVAVSDGFVVINGELLPFKGGTKQDYVRIQESVDAVKYETSGSQDTYFRRWVEFGTKVEADRIAWASLVRIDNLQVQANDFAQQLSELGTNLVDHTADPQAHPRDTRNQIAGSYQVAGSYQAAGTYNTVIGTNTDVYASGANIISNINVTDGVINSMKTRTLKPSDIGAQVAGTYNTVIGTNNDINTSGSTIIDNINVTDGVITSMGSRRLTPGSIGASYSNHRHDILVHKASTEGLYAVGEKIDITGKGYISLMVFSSEANNTFSITGSDISFGRQIIIFNRDDSFSIYIKSGVLADSENYKIPGGVAVTLVWDTSNKYHNDLTGGHWIVVSRVDQDW